MATEFKTEREKKENETQRAESSLCLSPDFSSSVVSMSLQETQYGSFTPHNSLLRHFQSLYFCDRVFSFLFFFFVN